ncbi:MAG TPA: hypothetical protein VG273_27935 [Bryobacteraceae bacterium]|jgi:hypothetical protein|nr:hypothetical protein [Bryobacteraceae bacterium]
MKTAAFFALLFVIQTGARADFSYTTTRKVTGGAMASMAGTAANGVSKISLKGQKMMTQDGDSAVLIDFGAATITTINNTRKTYSTRPFSDITNAQTSPNITVDAKETGKQKKINGYDCKELLMTMQMDMGQGRGMGGKMDVEDDMWISSEVPGVGELRTFYQRNAGKFPWAAMGGGNQAMQSAMTEMQKKIASMNGVPVEQVISIKPGAGMQMPAMPQMSAAQAGQLDQARARLEAMAAQGGPAAAAAQQALSRMGAAGAGRGAAPGGNPGALMEMTMDSSDFSTASIPDSVFAIPGDYQKVEAR